jgi:hypothetical protein
MGEREGVAAAPPRPIVRANSKGESGSILLVTSGADSGGTFARTRPGNWNNLRRVQTCRTKTQAFMTELTLKNNKKDDEGSIFFLSFCGARCPLTVQSKLM